MNKELRDLLRNVSYEAEILAGYLQGSHTYTMHRILLQETKKNLITNIKQLLTKLEENE